MKKTLLFMAAVTVMFASCQKSLNETDSNRREIRLKAATMSLETKSFSETTNDTFLSNGFKATAVIDADNSTMFNEQVSYDNEEYGVPGKHYYFPIEGTMSFYGVYPEDEVITVADDGKVSVSYVHNPDDDLIGASKNSVESQSNAVALEFYHLLSQVAVNAKTDDDDVICKVYGVTITGADGGTYNFADGNWTLNGTKADCVYFVNADGQAVTTTGAALGSAMSVMPGKVNLNVKWKCFNKVGEQLISDNDETIPVTLTKGKSTVLNLLLPVNATQINVSTSVGAWTEEIQDLTVKPYVPELLSGVFTVRAAEGSTPAKKVKFTKGNLYWNGKEFRCEENQYDYPTALDSTHVGHLHWSKDARVAYAVNYNAANTEFGITPATDDKFFVADGGLFEGYTVLDYEEWNYLIDNALVKNSQSGNTIIIDGRNCVVLKPDGFEGTVADSYTAEQWDEAESQYGLVAVPFAGRRDGTIFSYCGSRSILHCATSGHPINAYFAKFTDSESYTKCLDSRNNGLSIRLVAVQ